MESCPEYCIYFAQQKVAQLYRQLPEACVVARKASRNTSEHGLYDIQLPPPQRDGGDAKKQPYLSHSGQDRTCTAYQEAVFEKNEMYQLRRVLRCLRRAGRLQPLPCAAACPGMFYSFCACFAAEAAAAPPAGILLYAACGRGLRLCCEPGAFTGGDAETLRRLVWAEGGTLPLGGVLLCLATGADFVAGLPLYLSIRKNK
ncbi:MAG: hypothetical protein LBS96_05840 [Oscillospiraceae bacterium]|nr:hypothetical protein [Oscillospiraceae bacterium]